MALTDDQRAMLRLLAQREQGYEDIAALMGLSVDEVRAKVKDALAEIDTVAKSSPSLLSRIRLPKDQRLLAGGLAGVVTVVLILILALSGGESSSSSSTTTTATTPASSANTTASSQNLTQAVLAPVNGGNASGKALFGRVKNTPVLQVEAQGLNPSPSGQSYTVWLYRSPKLVLRIGAVRVGKSGGIAAQFPIPTQVLAYVAGGAFDQIDLSLTSDAAYRAEVAKAKREKRLPAYTGEDILRGKITGPAVKK